MLRSKGPHQTSVIDGGVDMDTIYRRVAVVTSPVSTSFHAYEETVMWNQR